MLLNVNPAGGGKLNFDKCIATPMFMPRLSKVHIMKVLRKIVFLHISITEVSQLFIGLTNLPLSDCQDPRSTWFDAES